MCGKGKAAIDWDNKWHPAGTRKLANGKMHGLAFCWIHEWDDSAGSGEIVIRIERNDGTASILGCRADIGVNAETAYCQVAADGITTQTVTIATAKTGSLAVELTPDASVEFNTDETAANVDESIQSSDVGKETTPGKVETEPNQEINLWLISGIPAGVAILTVTVWLITKRRY